MSQQSCLEVGRLSAGQRHYPGANHRHLTSPNGKSSEPVHHIPRPSQDIPAVRLVLFREIVQNRSYTLSWLVAHLQPCQTWPQNGGDHARVRMRNRA
jgi:hypothetical protein